MAESSESDVDDGSVIITKKSLVSMKRFPFVKLETILSRSRTYFYLKIFGIFLVPFIAFSWRFLKFIRNYKYYNTTTYNLRILHTSKPI